ncbi:MAG: MBOAT family protein [Fretibacterium sp.]|nr:MBOAT family protein [Fretibacterium sp.]
MTFVSIEFIVFFLLVLLGALITQRLGSRRGKEWLLLGASYFFYGWWDWRFCFLLLFVTAVSYWTARAKGKTAYILGLSTPLIVLGFFKYFNFFLSSLSAVAGRDLGTLRIILPVGISFYTFQALSYVIDVRRGKLAPEKNFVKLALYISFFPQLVAGPIVRAADFLPQLEEDRKITAENFKIGIQMCAVGFFKKVVLADHLSVFVDDVFAVPVAFHWLTILLAAASYSLQIYFDFSGYSDIAIGCAKCLGYDFKRNFNLPYISQSVTEFWRRWHISLSTWLKEYLYIPLGGNRKGKLRQLVNILVTMLLGGLWHGANWTFVFWGGINGLALCAEKLLPQKENGGVISRCLKIAATFVFISFTWIFFRARSFANAWAVVRGIVTLQWGIVQPFFWSFVAIVILLIATVSAAVRARRNGTPAIDGHYPILNLDRITGLTAFFVFVGVILGLAFTGENPFVYFQF